MLCYIDGNQRTSDMFWKEVQVLLSPGQRLRLLDGIIVNVGGREYQVITDELMEQLKPEEFEQMQARIQQMRDHSSKPETGDSAL